MGMLIWMTLRVRAMVRFQTEVSEALLNDAPARWVIYAELDRVETAPQSLSPEPS